jgi:predicted anti-sigma-YlaC factor YlaD
VTSGDELSCQELVELVTDYLEDTLSPVDRARFEAHLGGCEACSIYLDQMRTTIRVAGSLSEDAIPPAARGELLQAFRDWKRA